MKFGDLSVEKTWEAFKVLKGKRLTGSFGLLWGVKIPDTMTDDMPEEDLPYLEMLYKFTYGKKSYYDLLITRHVEAQAGERAELGGATTTPDEDIARVLQVLNKVRNGAWRPRVEQRSVLYRSFNVKKAHWRIPPSTRVRVRQRIRRWDGIMYNIDLFPYVEHRLLAFIG